MVMESMRQLWNDTNPDEKDKLIAGMLAFLPESSSGSVVKTPQMREHYQRLIPKLDDVYHRTLLYHVALEDWSEVLAEGLVE